MENRKKRIIMSWCFGFGVTLLLGSILKLSGNRFDLFSYILGVINLTSVAIYNEWWKQKHDNEL